MVVVLGAVAGSLALPATPAFAFHDIQPGYWAGQAPAIVSVQHDWMRDYGIDWFHPNELVTRRMLARAVVKAFASDVLPEPNRVFSDLPATDPDYAFANVAVGLGYIAPSGTAFRPNVTVPKWDVDRALVMALGLKDAMAGLNKLRTADGHVFSKPKGFAEMALAMELELHYNHPTENGQDVKDLEPWTAVNRAELAYALVRSKAAQSSWMVYAMHRYETITLPKMSDIQMRVVTFALQWTGYPYIYGGEWYRPTGSGYCCGTQLQGGFDCSGTVWWVLQRSSASFPVNTVRSYAGWTLPQRTSDGMARYAPVRLGYGQLQPGDIVTFQSDWSRTDWAAIDHAGLYIGNGWMLHSSGSRAGVTISWMGSDWWRDHFRWGRRLI